MKSNPRTLEYGGDISSLPVRAVIEMVDEQIRQGNDADYSVFEKDFWACQSDGGFNWEQSEKGYDSYNHIPCIIGSVFSR